MTPCTNKVDHEETVNIPWKKEESFSLKLKSYDTPLFGFSVYFMLGGLIPFSYLFLRKDN